LWDFFDFFFFFSLSSLLSLSEPESLSYDEDSFLCFLSFFDLDLDLLVFCFLTGLVSIISDFFSSLDFSGDPSG